MKELTHLRTENSKTFADAGRRRLEVHIGAPHYKDNYADKSEGWKDIDLTWEGNRITKAPYELTLEGNKAAIRNKKSGEVSTIELLEIGRIPIPPQAWELSKGLARAFDTDLEIKVENGHVRFARILKSDKAPKEAKFRVTGNFRVFARDEEGELPVETTLKDGILTEILKPDRPIKYPVRIDPTWQTGESTDDAMHKLVTDWWTITGALMAGGLETHHQYGSGMRFPNVAIPQGAPIDEAHLTLRCQDISGATATPCNSRITAEDIDNAATFVDDKVIFDARYAAHTTAVVDWDNISVWLLDTEYDSPDIKTVLQEIVNREGWATGQGIAIFWQDYDNRTPSVADCRRIAHSYDTNSSYAPKLVVDYTPPSLRSKLFPLKSRG
ncbi:hypothetical protein ES703_94103 [subsurface metagenome]